MRLGHSRGNRTAQESGGKRSGLAEYEGLEEVEEGASKDPGAFRWGREWVVAAQLFHVYTEWGISKGHFLVHSRLSAPNHQLLMLSLSLSLSLHLPAHKDIHGAAAHVELPKCAAVQPRACSSHESAGATPRNERMGWKENRGRREPRQEGGGQKADGDAGNEAGPPAVEAPVVRRVRQRGLGDAVLGGDSRTGRCVASSLSNWRRGGGKGCNGKGLGTRARRNSRRPLCGSQVPRAGPDPPDVGDREVSRELPHVVGCKRDSTSSNTPA